MAPHHDVLLQLYQLPAAAGISSEAVLQQLQAWAGSSSFPEVAEPLCAIPAVAQFSSEAVVVLLSIALEHHLSESLNEMLHRLLPVVHEQLGSQQVAQLLETAVEHDNDSECIEPLCQLSLGTVSLCRQSSSGRMRLQEMILC